MRSLAIPLALAAALSACSSLTDPEVAELPEITVGTDAPETAPESTTSTTEAPVVLEPTPQAPTPAGALADYGARLAATAVAGPVETACGTIAVAAVGPTDPGIVDSRDAPTADLHDLRWNGEAWEPTISPLAEVLWDDSTGNGLIGYGLRGVAIGLVDGNAGLEQLAVQAGILHCLVGNERVEGPAAVGALAGDVHLRQKEEACQRIARFA